MASFSLSQNDAGTLLTWTVRGLSSGDKICFHIRYEPNDNNQHYRRFPSSGYYSVTGTTYTFSCSIEPGQTYACTVNVNAAASNLPLQYITANEGSTRPDDWSWSGIIYSGAPLSNLTASVWNRFTARINEFREYKNQSSYSFTTARSGVTDIADCVPEAVAAIRGLNGHGTLPSSVTISASTWIQLANAMNAVS